jgi:hypothetical protein
MKPKRLESDTADTEAGSTNSSQKSTATKTKSDDELTTLKLWMP